MFFGQYLIKQGEITEEQLEKAIRLQKENSVLLGELAVQKEYLTPYQVDVVVNEQRSLNKKFGDIALSRGLLSEGQIADLLYEQSENHIFLGEALNRLGFIGFDRLNVCLNTFKGILQKKEEYIHRWMAQFWQVDLLNHALSMIEEYFFRLGYIFKVHNLEQNCEISTHNPVFMAGQEFVDHGPALFGLQMPWNIIKLTAQGNPLLYSGKKSAVNQYELSSEVVQNLNNILCDDLKSIGYNVQAGPLYFETPNEYAELFKITMSSILGGVSIMYFFL